MDCRVLPELEKLITDARNAGYEVMVIRALLTYNEQKEIYDVDCQNL